MGQQAGDSLQIKVQPFVVSIAATGPAKATCSCPAPGICQHILIAGLFLQTHTSSAGTMPRSSTPGAIREEIAFFTPERLQAWAGSADYRAGIALLEKNALPPVIEYGETILIRLLPSSIEARYVPHAGLDRRCTPCSLSWISLYASGRANNLDRTGCNAIPRACSYLTQIRG